MVGFGCQEKFTKKYCRPIAWHADEAAIGSDNADAAFPSPITLHNGCGINEATALELKSIHELSHSLLHYVVVILSLNIEAHGGLLMLGHKVHGKADNRLYARN